MEALLIYLLKSATLLTVFVALFVALMQQETYHKLNRFTLLAIIALSLSLPLVNLGIETPFSRLFSEEPATTTSETGIGFVSTGILTPAQTAPTEPTATIEWSSIAVAIYLIGVMILLARLVIMYTGLARIIKRGTPTPAEEYTSERIHLRVREEEEIKPFSWFRYVVINRTDLRESGREIITHEAAHARSLHSMDIVVTDLLILLQWFNPMAWFTKYCIKNIHEYEADEAVINSGTNVERYQQMIIKKAVGARLYSIANSFNHCLTKKRITMMCKEKSKKWRCAKALYIVPVVAIAACSLSTQENNDADSVSKDNEFIVTNSFLQIDTARLNTAYRELMKRPSDKKCQEAFFDAFPANWDEFITTYGYFPQDGYDLTMYYLAYEHIKALGDCSASIDSVAYCRKLVNIAVGGIFQADAPNHFQSLLHRVMWERMDAMLDYISQLRRGYQMRFWQFYWSSIVPNKKSEDEYARLYERNFGEYPEEMNIMKIAFEYFHNGVNIHGSYIE